MSQFLGRKPSIISYSFKYILSAKQERRPVPTEAFPTQPAKVLGSTEPLVKFFDATEESPVAQVENLVGIEPFAKYLGATEKSPELRGTPTESLDGNELLATTGILTSLGKFKLDSRETSVAPKRSKAVNSQASSLTFDFLGNNERLKSVPRLSVPIPPSMTYQSILELKDLVHDWEFGETIVINKCFVPLQFWQAVYKDHFPLMWGPIKGTWSMWRVRDPSF
jgi:hypothetical protein